MGVFKYDEFLTMARLKIVGRKKKKELFVSPKLPTPITTTRLNRNVQEMVHFNIIP